MKKRIQGRDRVIVTASDSDRLTTMSCGQFAKMQMDHMKEVADLQQELIRVRAENKRYREALEFIAYQSNEFAELFLRKRASQALRGGGGE